MVDVIPISMLGKTADNILKCFFFFFFFQKARSDISGADLSCKLSPQEKAGSDISGFDISCSLSPKGDNLHEMSAPAFWKNVSLFSGKKIKVSSFCHLLNVCGIGYYE